MSDVKGIVNKILEGVSVREALYTNEYAESAAPSGSLIINQYGSESDRYIADTLEVIGDQLLSRRRRPYS